MLGAKQNTPGEFKVILTINGLGPKISLASVFQGRRRGYTGGNRFIAFKVITLEPITLQQVFSTNQMSSLSGQKQGGDVQPQGWAAWVEGEARGSLEDI